MPDRQLRDFLAGVVGVVDASSYEYQALWEHHHQERGITWEQRADGLLETIGALADMPVCLRLNTAIVGGFKLLFITPTSQVVDHRLIDKWLADNLPRSAWSDYAPIHVNRTDATNFNNVFPRKAAA